MLFFFGIFCLLSVGNSFLFYKISPVHLMVNFFVLCLSYVNFFKERESMNF